MKKHIFLKILVISLAITFVGCEKFLDEPPEKKNNLEIKNTESLDLLLNYYEMLFDRSRESVWATDNFGLYPDYYDERPSRFDSGLPYMLWYPEQLAQGSYYWSREYLKISYANTILAVIDEIEGPENDKKRLIEDAHLLRAYEYFQLATLYCLPYSEQNQTALGLPLKRSTDYSEDLTRKTLGETMEFIEDELELALQTTITRNEDALWRISKEACWAFAARFYLYLHDYEKALQYAKSALNAHSTLVDYESYFGSAMRTYNSNGGTYTIPNPTSDYGFEEFYFARMMYNHTGNAVPSQSLLNLYDQVNDFRYEGFIVEDYSLNRAGVPGWPAYMQFGSIGILSGTTTAEMYLIRAECRARDNDLSGALDDLNLLRSYRYKSGTYTDLTLTDLPDKKSLLQFIIDERRREFPFTKRWYDIKRINSDPEAILDRITVSREFYAYDGIEVDVTQTQTYTLSPDDPRYAWPIPEIEIQLTRGSIVQNPY